MSYDDYGEEAAGDYDQDYDEDEHYYGAESYQVVRKHPWVETVLNRRSHCLHCSLVRLLCIALLPRSAPLIRSLTHSRTHGLDVSKRADLVPKCVGRDLITFLWYLHEPIALRSRTTKNTN